MNVLVNALSVTNLSGRHVLMGHLRQLAQWTQGAHRFLILHHAANADTCEDLGPHVTWLSCPAYTRTWLPRLAWERACIPHLIKKHRMELFFTPAGIGVPGLAIPQVVFCQNPWALVDLPRTLGQSVKAALQRHAYRQTVHYADMMVFNSHYMLKAYTQNAGREPRIARVAYQALAESTVAAATIVDRNPYQVVSVSAMAPHKGAEITVQAIAEVRRLTGLPVTLEMAGPWPDEAYRRRIEDLVVTLDLGDAVMLRGKVSRETLHQLYAESTVFCLMSRCESFGIPAIEAQAFGTPVVSSNCCAIPEVCGPGGLYPHPDDVSATAQALVSLLTERVTWEHYSAMARDNAARYRWEICSRPLLDMFEIRP